MPKLVIISILLLILLAYAMFFTSWNLQKTKVVGLQIGTQQYWEEIPVAYLVLVGVVIGVVAMATATLLQWQGQRAAIKRLSSQIAKARQVLEQQKRRIAELEAQLSEARTATETAVQVAEEPLEVELEPAAVTQSATAEVVQDAQTEAQAEPEPMASGEDDEEII
ncbi:MAG: hypothetical protein AB7W28_10010 [Armatimonadota bacterium]